MWWAWCSPRRSPAATPATPCRRSRSPRPPRPDASPRARCRPRAARPERRASDPVGPDGSPQRTAQRPAQGGLSALEDLLGLLSLRDRLLRRPHLLDLAQADVAEQRTDEEVEAEDDRERPLQSEALAVPVDEVGDRDRQHDQRHQREERGRGEE